MDKLVCMMKRVQEVQKQVGEVSACINGAESNMFFVIKGGDNVETVVSGNKDLSKFHSLLEEYIKYKEDSIAKDVDTLTAIDGLISVGDDESKMPAVGPGASMPAVAPPCAPAPMKGSPFRGY